MQNDMEQMDLFSQTGWSGKTSPEPSQATMERISELSWRKQQESLINPPLFLDLRTDGVTLGAFWETDGASLGEFTMLSFGECPSVVKESRLSQILEEQAHPKYSLSAKACRGILTRAAKRGKELPRELKEALDAQSLSRNEPESPAAEKES